MKNESFTHFIITRYNIPIKRWEKSKDQHEIDNYWLEHRYKLFKNYCFSSICNQSNQNFFWLIFLDKKTPVKYKEQLEKLLDNYPNYLIVYVIHYKHFLKKLQTIIDFKLQKEFLITTRLDNDDCIRKDFVQLIQNNFDYQDKCIIDFPHGYTLEIEPTTKLAYRQIPLNPFISLIEKRDSFITIMHYFRHRAWKKTKVPVNSQKGKRVWMQIIHNKNYLNMFKGMLLCNKHEAINDFGISLPGHLQKENTLKKINHFCKVLIIKSKNRIKHIKRKLFRIF